MLPTREEALKLIRDGLLFNPGPWGKHCLTAAHCAEKIASACGDMDVEKAYILGLLHDIGRKFGVRHLGHVYDGYVYMKSLGYDEVAKICLTHSFNNHTIDEYIGKFDVTDEEVDNYITDLKKMSDEAENADDVKKVIAQFDSEDEYWAYEKEVYQKQLPIQKYVESLENDYVKKSGTDVNNESGTKAWNKELDKIKEKAAKEQKYKKVKSVKDIDNKFVK